MAKAVPRRLGAYKAVLGMIQEREQQLYALASSLANQLGPTGDWNADGAEDTVADINAWRLAQVLEDMLSDSVVLKYAKHMLMEEPDIA